MTTPTRSDWHHDHVFDQDIKKPGENRTLIVIAITTVMMVVELIAGVAYGSMALLADGLHMASHAVALSISAFAYVYARRNADNVLFSFGTGKVNALGGFTGAVLLALFATYMAIESVVRLLNPVEIVFNQAIAVAVAGLLVNGISVFILGGDHHHHHDDHHHEHEHDHHHDHAHSHHQDHNLKSAYFHVLADALTSVLAIAALLAGKYVGAVWMDPVMGILGAILVARWSAGLMKTTSGVLLDRQGPEALQSHIRDALEERNATQVTDLHVWSIGPDIYSAVITLVAREPLPPSEYKEQLPTRLGLVHITIEVHEWHE